MMEFDFHSELFDDLSFMDATTSSDNSFLNDTSRWGFNDIHNYGSPVPCGYRCQFHCQCQSTCQSQQSKKKRKSPTKKKNCNNNVDTKNKTAQASKAAKTKSKTKKPAKKKKKPVTDVDTDTDTEVEGLSLAEEEEDEHNTTKRRKQKPTSSQLPDQVKAQLPQDHHEETQEEWNYRDSSVGTKILRYFPVNGVMTEFVGQVVAYGPPSSSSAGDQLFKVKYPDDSDVEDLDQAEYDDARRLMAAVYATK